MKKIRFIPYCNAFFIYYSIYADEVRLGDLQIAPDYMLTLEGQSPQRICDAHTDALEALQLCKEIILEMKS